MSKFSLYSLALCATFVGYYLISQVIFNKIFETSKIVIDEEFHIPQGLAYCNFTFNTWNPKITTLPGLYLISALILGPFNACTIYWLRFTNLLASVLNLLLIYTYFTLFTPQNPWNNLLSSINLMLLPPLYFFAHLYYTDVLSITFVLLHIILSKSDKHILASITGLLSIVMRQTNVIWVIMTLGQYAVKEIFLHSSVKKSKKARIEQSMSFNDMKYILKADIKDGSIFQRFSLRAWLNISLYFIVLLSFGVFVIINGGIVVGDKTAHIASVHLAQLFYFAVFCLVFGWPHFVLISKNFIKFTRKTKIFTMVVIAAFTVIVYFNTIMHPYLLADNRHYSFYIWNRFYGKYSFFRYLMIPIYYFGFYGILSKMYTKRSVLSLIIYSICITLSLTLQKLIEIRYFLIPYILIRLNFKNIKLWQLILEFFVYLILNMLTLNIFFTKEIYWPDFTYTQKLIW